MFLRILVPLDGSPVAERALFPATLLACQTRASQSALEPLVTLFRAVDLSSWLERDEFEDRRAQAMESATRYLEARAERLRSQGVTVETAVRLGTRRSDP